jgi:hypothetical protein
METHQDPAFTTPPFYPASLCAALQASLAALADLDHRYERFTRTLDGRAFILKVDAPALRRRLQARHRRERRRFEARLSAVHGRLSDYILEDLRGSGPVRGLRRGS